MADDDFEAAAALDVSFVRANLATEAEGSADWRRQKAEEHPDDARNAQSAAALERAAAEVAKLPDDDPRLLRLAQILSTDDDDLRGDYLDEESRLLSRHGFGTPKPATTDELLADLVEAADGAVERAAALKEASRQKVGPIEVWLTLRDGGFGVNCMVVRDDESTTQLDIDSLTMRGAEREITGWLLGNGYKAAGRWETMKEDRDENDLEAMRRFAPAREGATAL